MKQQISITLSTADSLQVECMVWFGDTEFNATFPLLFEGVISVDSVSKTSRLAQILRVSNSTFLNEDYVFEYPILNAKYAALCVNWSRQEVRSFYASDTHKTLLIDIPILKKSSVYIIHT